MKKKQYIYETAYGLKGISSEFRIWKVLRKAHLHKTRNSDVRKNVPKSQSREKVRDTTI